MKSITASIFRWIFACRPLRYFYYGLYEKVFLPYRLFEGVTKTISYRKKFKLKLDINDWIPQNIYFLGSYEEKEIRFLEKILKEGDTFIDVGANIGIFSLAASEIVGPRGCVYSFEPFSENFKTLKDHIDINNLKNVKIERLALSDKIGAIQLHINDKDSNNAMATAYPADFTYSETVEAVTFDDYASKNDIRRIRAIKIDVEGGEYPVLAGMKRVLEEWHPVIIMEINPQILKQTSFTEESIVSLLNGLSYKKMFLNKSGELTDILVKGDSSCNYVFV